MRPGRRPDTLVIHTNQQRFDCLGAYGNRDIRTPNIDALAADGVVYENSFCVYPVCTPSRYSLLSGLYVRQHLGRSNRSTLPAGVPTFPRCLRDEGLADRMDLLDQRAEFREHAGSTYWDSSGARRSDLDEKHHSTTWSADRAVEELDAWGPGDNMLMVGFVKPHHPFDPPEPWGTAYEPDGWRHRRTGTCEGIGVISPTPD
jgi:hypothetical protein